MEPSEPAAHGGATPAAAEPSAAAVPRLARGFRLQWEEAQQAQVLLYPEGMVKLNGSAGEIMKRVDGQRSVAAIVAELQAAFQTQGLDGDVRAFLAIAARQHWLEWE